MYDGRREKKQLKTKTTDRHGRVMTVDPAADTPMKRFFESVDHETLHYALAENPKYAAFLAALLNPEFKRYTFMRIARDHGFTLHELQVLYTDFSRHMALLQALPSAAKALPQVMNEPDLDFLLMTLAVAITLCVTTFVAALWLGRFLAVDEAQEASLMYGLGMNNNGTGLVLASLSLAAYPQVMLPIIFYNLVQHVVAGIVQFLKYRTMKED